MTDDNVVGPFQVGFDFKYYWNTISEIYIGSNGYISFDPITISSAGLNFPTIPTADATNNFIAPLLSDLKFDGAENPGAVYFYSNGLDSCIISFHNVPFWTGQNINQYIGDNTFQIILTASDFGVLFQYQAIEDLVATEYQAGLNPVIIGIESSSGTIGLQAVNTLPVDNTCLRFKRPANPMIDIFDAAPVWIFNPDNKAIFIEKDKTIQPTIGVENIGNIAMTDVQIFATVLDQFGGVLASINQSISQLSIGETKELNFLEDIVFDQVGSYTITAQLISAQDINLGNDILNNKLVVIDTETDNFNLGYVNVTTPPAATLSWLSSVNYNNGGALYLKPPIYPLTIAAIEYYLFDVAPVGFTNGFRAQILDDDGENGSPGSVLFEKDIPATNLNATAWTTINLEQHLTIEEGGVYLAFRQEGIDIGLGIDNTASSFSRQTWELLNNVWGPYRGAANQEFYIRAIATGNSTTNTTYNPTSNFIYEIFPNPFKDDLLLHINLIEKKPIEWHLFHPNGQKIGNMEKELAPGGQFLLWNNIGATLSSGVYFYQLKIGNDWMSGKVLKH